MENILEMLRKGATPESIYQEAIAAQEKLNKEAAEDLKISRLREKAVKALDEYYFSFTNHRLTAKEKKDLDTILQELEKAVTDFKVILNTSIPDKKKTTSTLEDLFKGIWV